MAPEEVAQIIDALMDTAPMQWVVQQMQGSPDNMEEGDGLEVEEAPAGDDGLGGDDLGGEIPDGGGLEEAPPEGGEVATEEGPGDLLGDDELADMDDEERAEYDSYEDDQKAVYARGRRRGKGRTKPAMSKPMKLSRKASGQTEAERYARERAEAKRNTALDREVNGLKTRLAHLEKEKRHATRYSRLQDKQADGYVFDLEEEFADLKDVSEDEFSRALKRVEKYQTAPVGDGYLPTPALPAPRDAAQKDQYSRKRAARAVEICQSEGIEYHEALAKATKELDGK